MEEDWVDWHPDKSGCRRSQLTGTNLIHYGSLFGLNMDRIRTDDLDFFLSHTDRSGCRRSRLTGTI